MKYWVAVALATLLLLTMVGCEGEKQQDPLVQTYIENAQKYITTGDFDTAVALLEDGLTRTNQNSEIVALLEQLKEKYPQQENTSPTDSDTTNSLGGEETIPTAIEPCGFVGYWESENYFIGIQETEEKLCLSMLCYSGEHYDEYIIISTVETSAATESKVTFPFDDDSYGNSGNVVLYLEGDTLNYVIADYVSAAEPGEEPKGIGIACSGGSLKRTEKMPAPLELLEDFPVSDDDEGDIYVGEWADYISERATMSIVKTAGKYSIKIVWSNSATETAVWTMTAVEKQEQGEYWLESDDCKKTVAIYGEDGFVSKEVEYEEGKAMIFHIDETLNWVDYTEYAGDDCCFERIP